MKHSNFAKFFLYPNRLRVALLIWITCVMFSTSSNAFAKSSLNPNHDIQEVFLGDLPAMKRRHVIRALVTYSKTNFFIVKGQPHGFEYDLLQAYAQWLNKGIKKGQLHTQIVYIPVPFDQLLAGLTQGKGDIAASGLTITPERQKHVTFTTPYVPNVKEIIVANKQAKRLRSLQDLQGKSIYLAKGTSYKAHLQALNQQFRQRKMKPIQFPTIGAHLTTEDLLELTNSGVIKHMVADKHLAELWASPLPNIGLRPDLEIHKGGKIAWATRPNNPALRKSLNVFLKKNKKGTLLGNILFKRYYKNQEWITNPLSKGEKRKLDLYLSLFKKYGKSFQFDWKLLAAQAYQESRLDHTKKSSRGAVGLMQILPSTAHNSPIKIRNIHQPENNVHAGVKYLAYLRQHYFSHKHYTPQEQINFSLAAYNMGPSKLKSLQQRAKKLQLNPYVWFSHMEQVALRYVGREPVRYVANIYKYYLAYRQSEENKQKKSVEIEKLHSR